MNNTKNVCLQAHVRLTSHLRASLVALVQQVYCLTSTHTHTPWPLRPAIRSLECTRCRSRLHRRPSSIRRPPHSTPRICCLQDTHAAQFHGGQPPINVRYRATRMRLESQRQTKAMYLLSLLNSVLMINSLLGRSTSAQVTNANFVDAQGTEVLQYIEHNTIELRNHSQIMSGGHSDSREFLPELL